MHRAEHFVEIMNYGEKYLTLL